MTDYNKEYDLTKIPGPYLCKSGWWENRRKDLPPDSIYQELKRLCKQIEEDEKRLARLNDMKLPNDEWDPEHRLKVAQTEELLQDWSMHLEALNRIRERLVKMEFGNRGVDIAKLHKGNGQPPDSGDLPWSPGSPVEHSRYGALTEEHERVLKDLPYGAVNWTCLKVGDLVEIVSGVTTYGTIKGWKFGVITYIGPVKSPKGTNGPVDAVWASWKKDKESAIKKVGSPWPQGGSASYLADSMHGKPMIMYRILDRNLLERQVQELQEMSDRVRYKALTTEHEMTLTGIVDYTYLRRGDMVEYVPHKKGGVHRWNYFIIAFIEWPDKAKEPDIYALFHYNVEELKESWLNLKPEMRTDAQTILTSFCELDRGAILALTPGDKYRILERDIHLKRYNATQICVDQLRYNALTPEHERTLMDIPEGKVDYTQLRVGDLVENTKWGTSTTKFYGVVVHIGPWEATAEYNYDYLTRPSNVWAFWSNDILSAKVSFLNNRTKDFIPRGSGPKGALLEQLDDNDGERGYNILERGFRHKRLDIDFDSLGKKNYNALTPEHQAMLEGTLQGPVNYTSLRPGDYVRVVSPKSWKGTHGVVVSIGPRFFYGLEDACERGKEDSVWAFWQEGANQEYAIKDYIDHKDERSPRTRAEGGNFDAVQKGIGVGEEQSIQPHFDIIFRDVGIEKNFKALTPEHERTLMDIPEGKVDYTQLRVGDLVKWSMTGLGVIKYGVVVHIGEWFKKGLKSTVWAFLKSDRESAEYAFLVQEPEENFQPDGMDHINDEDKVYEILSRGWLYKRGEFENWNIQVGDRIELLEMKDDPSPVPKGTKGTVTELRDNLSSDKPEPTVDVKWDNGRTLSLIMNVDKFRILSRSESYNAPSVEEFDGNPDDIHADTIVVMVDVDSTAMDTQLNWPGSVQKHYKQFVKALAKKTQRRIHAYTSGETDDEPWNTRGWEWVEWAKNYKEGILSDELVDIVKRKGGDKLTVVVFGAMWSDCVKKVANGLSKVFPKVYAWREYSMDEASDGTYFVSGDEYWGALTPEHESYMVRVGDHVELVSVAPLFSGLKAGNRGIVNRVIEEKDGKITVHFQEDITKENYGLVLGRDASFKILPYIPEGLVDYTQLMVGDFVSARYDVIGSKSVMHYGVVTHIGRPEKKQRTTSSTKDSYDNWVYAIWDKDRYKAMRMFSSYSPGHFKIRKTKEERTLISGPQDHVIANTETGKNYTILERGLHRKDVTMGTPSNDDIPVMSKRNALDWLR